MNKIHASTAVYKKLKLFTPIDKSEIIVANKSIQYNKVEIKNLNFGYDNDFQFHQFNFIFEKGKKYAIVGGSGGGKSTLLNLITKKENCADNTIFIDGQDINTIMREQLLTSIAYMNQTVFLFNDTIYNNVTLFSDINELEYEQAIKAAGLIDFLNEQTQGSQYLIQNNGENVSGGQKQRIALARVLIRKSPMLLLDEAFSSLDPKTTYDLWRDIFQLNITCLAVFHDYDDSILRQCDSILAIKNGTLIEYGAFDELLEKKGYFYSLYNVVEIS
ncbi:MAG: ATP-binding cassette domain-containing protein [Lachnospiraceae bacterium]|nr:ATP-binding cassette domain-containing protein [Lachnospiraceae bacterium]